MEGRASDWRPGPTVCRCCLTEGCYKDISTEYFWMGKREVYAEMLSETLNVSIAFSKSGGPNSNSRLICEPCIARLRDASEFKRQVVDCEKTFMHHLDPGSSSRAREFNVETSGEVKVEVVKREKASLSDDDFDDRPDFLDVDTDDDLDDQPLTKLASKIPKKESVDLLDLLDSSQITVKRKSNLKLKEAPPKKIIKKKEVVKPSVSKTTPVKQAEKKKGEPQQKSRQYMIDKNNYKTNIQATKQSENKLTGHKERVMKLLMSSRICPFKWKSNIFYCIYCNEQYSDPVKLKEHNQVHGDLKQAEIQRALTNLKTLGLVKADISDISCKLCDAMIDTFDDLKNHLVNKHEHNSKLISDDGVLPFILDPGSFKCGSCDEGFPEYRTLTHHLKTHFQNYTCEQCGTGFVSESALRRHFGTHETGSFSCNECDKVFRTKESKLHHEKIVHLKAKRNRCPYCLETFLYYFQKLNHIATAHGIIVKQFTCDMCPSVFNIRGKLNSHIRTTHLKEKRYACDDCDANFSAKSGVRNHMLTHTGVKKYKCEVCQKAYGRQSTLRQHMRIHLDDRRFVCNVCEKSFVQKCSLKHHGRTHHPDHPNPAGQYD